MNRCTGINRDGTQCRMKAVTKGLCFAHSKLPSAEIFQWDAGEIENRIRCLSVKELQALELVCAGEVYEKAAVVLGITSGSFANRLSIARKLAGMKTIQQLIALYAVYRAQIGGERMP